MESFIGFGQVVCMRAVFNGDDYTLILDRAIRELDWLRYSGQKLSAPMERPWKQGAWSDKIATLEFGKTSHPDGIEMAYVPANAEDWDHIREARFVFNDIAYRHIADRGSFGTRYDGSNKVQIFNGDPAEM